MQPQYAYQTAPMNAPLMMAGGGLADAAKMLQSRGRGDDTMLVHMTPGEVKGLQALAMAHGGSLTTNPDTGLPEAGFLKNLLPTIAGIGLNFLFPGSGALIGLGIGGLETLRTGDLGKGILAGLGAYGGANIGQALTSMGAEAAATSALPVGGATATGVPAAAGESLLAQSISAPQMSAVPGLGGESLVQAAPMTQSAISALQDQAAANFAQQGMFDQLGQGAQAAMASPSKFASTLYGQMGTTGSTLAAIPTINTVSEALTPKYAFPTAEESESTYAGPYYPTARSVRFKPEDDTSTSEFTFFTPSNPVPGYQPYYAAQGGLMGLADGGAFDDEPGKDDRFAEGGLTALSAGGVPLKDGSFVFDARTVSEAGNGSTRAGEKVLAAKFNAKPIRGAGDGVSDSVKANIGGMQEARVADGEMYVDPQDVKRAGGSKKLYDFMRKAEQARKKAKRGQNTGLAALQTA